MTETGLVFQFLNIDIYLKFGNYHLLFTFILSKQSLISASKKTTLFSNGFKKDPNALSDLQSES